MKPCYTHPGCQVTFCATRQGQRPPHGRKAWVFHDRGKPR